MTVVGGGILGMAAAHELAEGGHQVTLAEATTLGSASTAKAAGILSAMTWNDDDYRLIATTRGMIGELISLAMSEGNRAARGAWRPTPSLCIASGAGLRTLDQIQDRLERMTEETDRLDARRIEREFPVVSAAPGEEALVAQEDGVIDAGELVPALRGRLESAGVQLLESTAATRIRIEDGHCMGVEGPAALERAAAGAEAVVVAGGAWTGGLLRRSGIALPVQAYRTQLASLGMPDAADVPVLHDLVHHFYTRPEAETSFLAGNGTQLRPFDPDQYNERAEPEFVESIAQRVVTRFQQGAEATLRTGWAGLCVATPDRRPLCGAVRGQDGPVEGLFVLTGDNGFGLMRGLALGARLADAVRGKTHPATDPLRFPSSQTSDFVMREGYGDLATEPAA